MTGPDQTYLDPYARAARQHGQSFETLLWASPKTQEARFKALVRLCDFTGRQVLDAGCGRADLYPFLITRGMRPAHYIGLEALPEMLAAARHRAHDGYQIIDADFIRQPHRFLVGADLIVFCGSLNTLDTPDFYATLRAAFAATADILLFNFLCSPHLASVNWLTWHRSEQVLGYLRRFSSDIAILDDYTEGDFTIRIRRTSNSPGPSELERESEIGPWQAVRRH